MMNLKRSAIILSMLVTACAQLPQQAAGPAVKEGQEAQQAAPQAEQPAEQQVEGHADFLAGHGAEKTLNLPKLELSSGMFYDFLLGDIANQRGKPELAAEIYLDLAKSTRDPRVARRAAYLALDSRQMEKAVEAYKLWLELEPSSLQAKQTLATLLIGGGRLDVARPYLISLLESYPDKVGHALMQIYPMLQQQPEKDEVLKLVRELAQPYPRIPEAHWVMSQAAEAAGNHALALEEAHEARVLRPEWDMAAILEAQLLQNESPQLASLLLKKYLESYPDNMGVRQYYARALMVQKQYPEARAEFQWLLERQPDNAELAFAVALLSLELGELDRAEQELQQALVKGMKDDDTVYYYLGQLNEVKKNDARALENYRKVKEGEHLYAARLRAAYLIYKAGNLQEAREFLHQTAAQNNEQRVQLVILESQLLREAKQLDAAYRILAEELEKLPNHPDLLYATAMMADMVGRHEEFEQMMRKVIQLKPDYAQAYNALGYSLLDRNERVKEGMELVQQANRLAPQDVAIIDSVGWGYYRLGDLTNSLAFLRRAYAANPDPEIAAHLGEVLWMQGDKEQAKKIWDEARTLHPDNAVLREAIKKFLP